MYILCKNCKGWTVLLEGAPALKLTGEEINRRLKAKVERLDKSKS